MELKSSPVKRRSTYGRQQISDLMTPFLKLSGGMHNFYLHQA